LFHFIVYLFLNLKIIVNYKSNFILKQYYIMDSKDYIKQIAKETGAKAGQKAAKEL
jgi:hypothetical protein